MKRKELQAKNAKDLEKLLNEKREELRTVRFGSAGSKDRNVKRSLATRKDIARILTILNSGKAE